MRRLLRGLLRLAALAALGAVIYRLLTENAPTPSPVTGPSPAPSPEPARPPTRRAGAGTKPGGATRPPAARPPRANQPAPPLPPTVRSIGVGEAPAHAVKWVEPTADGAAPESHPVKVKLSSGVYHLPGGRHYERTHADRCYRDAESAEADGFRPSKQ